MLKASKAIESGTDSPGPFPQMGTQPHQSATSQHGYPLLDLARFSAAALVMLNHLRVNEFLPYSEVHASSILFKQLFFSVTRIGFESVMLFFVLSGFLVGGTSIDRAMRGAFEPSRYFIDRFTRIYVPFAPILLLTIGVCIWCGLSFSWSEAGMNLIQLQEAFSPSFSGNTALWSLSYEVWFYIFCGAVLMLSQSRGGWRALIGLGLMVASTIVFSRLAIVFLIIWLIGAGAFFLRPRRKWLAWIAGLTVSVAGLVLMQLTSVSEQVSLKSFQWVNRPLVIVIFSCGLGLLLALSARMDGPRLRRLSGTFECLAAFSYTLYLTHNPIMIVLMHYNLLVKFDRLSFFTIGMFVANALLILIISYGVYALFERQTPRVRQALYRAF